MMKKMSSKGFAFAVVSLVSLGAIVSAGGCASNTADQGVGGGGAECTKDADCKGDRVCEDGSCVDPGGSKSTGSGKTTSSTGSGPSCTLDAGDACGGSDCCKAGNTCVNYGGTLGQVCGADCTSPSGCSSGCCGALQGGGGACAPTEYCSIGLHCDSSNNCLAGDFCGDGNWCTDYCSNSDQCGNFAWCLAASSGNDECFPSCSTNADCAAWSGATCQFHTTVDSHSVYVCAY